jgi:hypothetical protein
MPVGLREHIPLHRISRCPIALRAWRRRSPLPSSLLEARALDTPLMKVGDVVAWHDDPSGLREFGAGPLATARVAGGFQQVLELLRDVRHGAVPSSCSSDVRSTILYPASFHSCDTARYTAFLPLAPTYLSYMKRCSRKPVKCLTQKLTKTSSFGGYAEPSVLSAYLKEAGGQQSLAEQVGKEKNSCTQSKPSQRWPRKFLGVRPRPCPI